MFLIDEDIDFDNYRLAPDSKVEAFHEEHFFNLAFWYMMFDPSKEECRFSTDLNPENTDSYYRLINVATSYLQLFFDYKYLIEDYKARFHGVLYSNCFQELEIVKNRLPSLFDNNSRLLADSIEFDTENIAENPNHFVYSDKQGGLKYKQENEFNPLGIFEYLSENKNNPNEKQQILAYKRLIMNNKIDLVEYQFFQAFNIHEEISLKIDDHPLIKKTLGSYCSPYVKATAIDYFTRISRLAIQNYVLSLIEYNFSIRNDLDISIVVSGPTEHIRQHLLLLTEFFKEYDSLVLTEILHSLAWQKLPNGELCRLKEDPLRRIVQREIKNFNKS